MKTLTTEGHEPSTRVGLTDEQITALLRAHDHKPLVFEGARVSGKITALHAYRAMVAREPSAKWWRLFIAFSGVAMLGIILLSVFGDALGSEWCAAIALVMIGSAVTGLALLGIAFTSEWMHTRKLRREGEGEGFLR